MDRKQEEHLTSIMREFCDLANAKYRKGQAEHGGNLWDVPPVKLLDFAIEEAIDQVIYLLTIRLRLRSDPRHNYYPASASTDPNRT